MSILELFLYSTFKPYLSKIEVNHDSKLVIIGNGPSLNTDIPKYKFQLSKCTIGVVNDFALTEMYDILMPKFYFLADSAYWLNECDINIDNVESRKKVFERIKNNTTWGLTIFIPTYAFRTQILQKEFTGFENINVCPMNTYNFIGFDSIKYFLYKRNLAMPQVQNVLVSSLFITINLGYKEIYVLGADHDWTKSLCVSTNNQVCTVETHFYDKEETNLKPWKKTTGEQYMMHEILSDLSKMFKGYFEVEKYARMKGANIYNSSDTTFIDVFERRKLDNNTFSNEIDV